MVRPPSTFVWGPVSDTREFPGRKGCIQVTVAGQVLTLQRKKDDRFRELGLLRLSRKGDSVFLIFREDERACLHTIIAGWKNPSSLTVRQMQSLVESGDESLYLSIARCPQPPIFTNFGAG